jgi:hypothetical protein
MLKRPPKRCRLSEKAELAQASGQLLQHRLLRQLLLTDLQGQPRAEVGMRAEDLEDFIQRLRISQGRRRQVQRQRIFMRFHLFQHALEHQPIQARGPAESLQPWQKTSGRDGLALFVEQAREHFVMQHQLRVGGATTGWKYSSKRC